MSHIIGIFVLLIGIVSSGVNSNCVQQNCSSTLSINFTELLPIPTDCTKFIMCNGIYKSVVMYNQINQKKLIDFRLKF